MPWVRDDFVVVRPRLSDERLHQVRELVDIMENNNACLLKRVVAAAYLTFWLDGGTSRLDYRALKLALGTTIGR